MCFEDIFYRTYMLELVSICVVYQCQHLDQSYLWCSFIILLQIYVVSRVALNFPLYFYFLTNFLLIVKMFFFFLNVEKQIFITLSTFSINFFTALYTNCVFGMTVYKNILILCIKYNPTTNNYISVKNTTHRKKNWDNFNSK